jgi:MoxR-like ATPase
LSDRSVVVDLAPGSRADWTQVPREDRTAAVRLPTPFTDRYNDAEKFDPGVDLTAAVNVALMLGQPLLLTGAPGCGKTSVGGWLAWQLGLGDVLVHNVKSTTAGLNLLYEFDELARFRDAQPKRKPRPDEEYLRFNALGLAILLSIDPKTKSGVESARLLGISTALSQPPPRFGQRHVVLIDELDKAPRDTPNDLLFEIESMEFAIPELRFRVVGDPSRRPIVVITSNTEKTLPEPFLRRCVFHHIKPPNAARRLEIIVKRRHPFIGRDLLFKQAMAFFERLHERLGRAPGTAELLAWLDILDGIVKRAEASPGSAKVETLRGRLGPSLGILAKTEDHLRAITDELGRAGLD